jgi:hypothetical protein
MSYSHRNNVGREIIKMIILVDNTQKHGRGGRVYEENSGGGGGGGDTHTHKHTHTHTHAHTL